MKAQPRIYKGDAWNDQPWIVYYLAKINGIWSNMYLRARTWTEACSKLRLAYQRGDVWR